ncbi:hypothetical protein DAPPUDRAFT_331829 [Daphnia pulex]|uniref:Uncharacterized protein n=1 Tax=Daphnia pulex TaxID=6669 RepID=E9HNJ8_DAPPU|nr:hypothetical protein DAPPUDRAFT_331829 [Daphnia pulex]|eukprot:EFX66678.1 hypothetical protein DAPPUDRAFT_331829 [Daphnia pulex]
MVKATKQLATSKAQPQLKKTLKNQKKPQRIKIPVTNQPVQPPKLVAILKVPYFPLQGPAKNNTLRIAYTQKRILDLTLLGLHHFLSGKGLACLTATDIDSQVLLRVVRDKNKADPQGFFPIAMSEHDVMRVITIRNHAQQPI